MEERDQILIERYLAGELTEAERHDVERRRDEDPLFREEITAYQIAHEALRQKQREELRQRFVKRDEILDKKKPEGPTSGRPRMTWLWVAAAVVIILVIWRFFLSSDQQAMPVQAQSSDSTRIEQSPAVGIDSLELKDSLRNQPQTEKPKEMRPDMAGNTKQGEELFAEYFEPYKDAMMDPSTRGDEELSLLQQYQKAYWDGEYPKAVELFSQLTPDNQGNDNYRFSYANALMKSGKTKEAIPVLKSIIQNNTSKYKTESRLILALAYVKHGDIKSAMPLLEEYLADDKAKQKDKAEKLKKAITGLRTQ